MISLMYVYVNILPFTFTAFLKMCSVTTLSSNSFSVVCPAAMYHCGTCCLGTSGFRHIISFTTAVHAHAHTVCMLSPIHYSPAIPLLPSVCLQYCLDVGVAVLLDVGVAVLLDVGVAVLLDVGVAVLLDVGVAMLLDVGVAVLLDVGVVVLLDVGGAVLLDVGVAVLLAVSVIYAFPAEFTATTLMV